MCLNDPSKALDVSLPELLRMFAEAGLAGRVTKVDQAEAYRRGFCVESNEAYYASVVFPGGREGAMIVEGAAIEATDEYGFVYGGQLSPLS